MPLTRDFRESMKARADADPAFRAALLSDAVELLLEGDVDLGKSVLRDFINATVGFKTLGARAGIPPKSLMRMFGPKGNPTAASLFAVISVLQRATGVHLEISAEAA